jgi:uncharacterized protein
LTLYLDASVIVPLAVTEQASEVTRGWINAQQDRFYTSHLAIGEAGSAISRRRRMSLLTDDQGDRALAALDAWLRSSVRVIDHDPEDIEMAAKWVRRPLPKLLMPDAIHLATCQRLRLRVVTGDVGLAEVAALLGIDWVIPS